MPAASNWQLLLISILYLKRFIYTLLLSLYECVSVNTENGALRVEENVLESWNHGVNGAISCRCLKNPRKCVTGLLPVLFKYWSYVAYHAVNALQCCTWITACSADLCCAFLFESHIAIVLSFFSNRNWNLTKIYANSTYHCRYSSKKFQAKPQRHLDRLS